jgi:catechol 2,3-dioxygenase-like lactoylglutathione lyase family enzyme
VRPLSLDHVAFWVPDADAAARWTVATLGYHVIERTERFTLVGADARGGKLTFFAADGEREPGPLLHVGIRLPGLSEAEDREAPAGLRIRLLPGRGAAAELDHVALRGPDPRAAQARWLQLGLEPALPGPDGTVRVRVADAHVELHEGPAASPARPLLNHLGVLVGTVAEVEAAGRAEELGEVELVDAPNTLAAFVQGPDGVRLEYVAHKPSFSLA